MPPKQLRVLAWDRLPGPAFGEMEGAHSVRVTRDLGELTAAEPEYCATVDVLIPTGSPALSAELLGRFPATVLISSFGLGLDHVDVGAATARGIPVCNTRGAVEQATAEFTIGLMLSLSRRIVEGDAMVRAGEWPAIGWPGAHLDAMLGTGLGGQRLGIVGLGGVGAAVARIAIALGMQVSYHQRKRAERQVERESQAQFMTLPSLLAHADVVSLHCPLTDQTRHLLDRKAISAMKPDALLINAARGPVVDEGALVDALESGRLGGAALDVFEREPDMTDRLWKLRNVVLTPHLGGATGQARAAMTELVCRQVFRIANGESPDRIVNGVRPHSTS